MAGVAIFGIGNVLLGDDGVGPAVARFLESNFRFPDGVEVEDLGTPSLTLPTYLSDRDVVIFVDAVAENDPPGTIRIYSRQEIASAPTGMHISPHEPSIVDALQILEFAGGAPRDVVLVGVVPHSLEGGLKLSDAVAVAVPRAAEAVMGELAKRGIEPVECGGHAAAFAS